MSITDDRLAQLSKLYETDPSDPFLSYGIALEYAKQERFEEVIEWLDKTLSLDENYFYAYYQKAKAQSQLGEDELAQATLEDGMGRAQAAGDSKAAGEMAELLEML